MPHIPTRALSQPTFGEMRRRGQAFTVECRRCGHAARFTAKDSQYLKSRLPADMQPAGAVLLFPLRQLHWWRGENYA